MNIVDPSTNILQSMNLGLTTYNIVQEAKIVEDKLYNIKQDFPIIRNLDVNMLYNKLKNDLHSYIDIKSEYLYNGLKSFLFYIRDNVIRPIEYLYGQKY